MSKTVIDEFVMSVGLDPKDFLQGAATLNQTVGTTKKHINELGEEVKVTNKVVFAGQKETQEGNKKTAESFGNVTKEIFKLTSAFLGVSAIKSAVSEITKADSALGRMGRNLNLLPGDIKAFEGVAKQFNISSDTIDSAFENTANVIAKYQTQGILDPTFLEGMGRAQIDYGKFLSGTTTDIERFIMVQDALNKAIESGRMTRMGAINVGGMMGYDPQVVTMMIETKDHLLEMVDAYKKLNNVTKEDTQLSDFRNRAWTAFTGEIESAWRASINGLTNFLAATVPAAVLRAQGHTAFSSGGQVYEQAVSHVSSGKFPAGYGTPSAPSSAPSAPSSTPSAPSGKPSAPSSAPSRKRFGYNDLHRYVTKGSTEAPPPPSWKMVDDIPTKSAAYAARIAAANQHGQQYQSFVSNSGASNTSSSTSSTTIGAVNINAGNASGRDIAGFLTSDKIGTMAQNNSFNSGTRP